MRISINQIQMKACLETHQQEEVEEAQGGGGGGGSGGSGLPPVVPAPPPTLDDLTRLVADIGNTIRLLAQQVTLMAA
jgi:hypothetical protein